MGFWQRAADSYQRFTASLYGATHVEITRETQRREMSSEDLAHWIFQLHKTLKDRVDERYTKYMEVAQYPKFDDNLYSVLVKYLTEDNAIEPCNLLDRDKRVVTQYFAHLIGLVRSTEDGVDMGNYELRRAVYVLYDMGHSLKDILFVPQKVRYAAACLCPSVACLILYTMIVRSREDPSEADLQDIFNCIFENEESSDGQLCEDEREHDLVTSLQILLQEDLPESETNHEEIRAALDSYSSELKMLNKTLKGTRSLQNCRHAVQEKLGLSSVDQLTFMQVNPEEEMKREVVLFTQFLLEWDDEVHANCRLVSTLLPLYRDFMFGKITTEVDPVWEMNRWSGFAVRTDEVPATLVFEDEEYGHSYAALWLMSLITRYMKNDGTIEVLVPPMAEYCNLEFRLDLKAATAKASATWMRYHPSTYKDDEDE